MDENAELLKAGFERIEGLIGEVKELRYKIKDGQGNSDGPSAEKREAGGAAKERGEPGVAKRLERIEERLDYLGAKWLELDERLFQLQRKNQH